MALLYLLPALVLALVMALRRYPGERRLLALSRGKRRAPRAERRTGSPAPRRQDLIPRGGLLIACSLAVRPPPSPAVIS